MIRLDKLHQWADTQMAPTPKLKPPGLADAAPMQPEAAHACTEIGAEPDGATEPGLLAALVPLSIPALAALAGAVSCLASTWP